MNQFAELATTYKYIQQTTWEAADLSEDHAKDLSNLLKMNCMKDKSLQLNAAIFCFHHIWNQQNIEWASQILQHLLQTADEILFPFFYFLEAKLHYFNNQYDLSLLLLEKAEQHLKNVNGNADYRILLSCIGSLQETDPENIEVAVMRAIISNDKGNNYHALKAYEKALHAFHYALNLQTASYSTMCHANVAYTYRCMVKNFVVQNKQAQAREYFNLAHAIAKVIYKNDQHPEWIAIKECIENC